MSTERKKALDEYRVSGAIPDSLLDRLALIDDMHRRGYIPADILSATQEALDQEYGAGQIAISINTMGFVRLAMRLPPPPGEE